MIADPAFNARVDWTDTVLEKLHDLRVVPRRSFCQIAIEMGMTRTAVSRKCRALGYPDVPEFGGGNAYTDAETAVLREQWAAGTTIREIADRLGRTMASVANRADLLKLPARRVRPVLTEEERKAKKRTENARLRDRLRALNPAAVTREWPQADIDTLRHLYTAGMTSSQIAKKMGRQLRAVTGKVQRLRLKHAPAVAPPPKHVGPVREAHYHTIADWAADYGLNSPTHGFDLAAVNAFRAEHGLPPFRILRSQGGKPSYGHGVQA